MPSSATTRRWPATWPTNPTSAKPRSAGTRARTPSRPSKPADRKLLHEGHGSSCPFSSAMRFQSALVGHVFPPFSLSAYLCLLSLWLFGHDGYKERIAFRVGKLVPLKIGAVFHRPVELETVVLDGVKVFDVLEHHTFPVGTRLAPELQVSLGSVGQLRFDNIARLPHFDGRFLHF